MTAVLKPSDALLSDPHTGDLVRCENLTKRYGDFTALSNCSLKVRRGEVFGLLGPNGAGKTTLIRTLLGYLHPTSGSCTIDGLDPADDSVAVRRQVAYLPGDARLPRHMRGKGLLEFFAEMHPSGDRKRSFDVADQLELDLSRRVAFMSTGMRQKLALAVVLGPRTPLLILDEPTANLDPTVRATVLDLVSSEQTLGRTVMFSSHVLSEIEQTCDRVAFLRKGQMAHELALEDLFQRHRVTARRTDAFPDEISIPPQLAEWIGGITQTDDRVQISTAGDLAPVLPWLATLPIEQVRIEPLGLHAIYQSVHLGETLPQLQPLAITDSVSPASVSPTSEGDK
ncbi:ABC transporter, ATP-binding protein [Rhodopirellula islandica]|uniref:ABC transporter, ATP-binding protein n=1 Tax=Rhodopirellula islandica TaxID=595434 RepID=A0A0J1B8D4_RHOIS|nr:ABC transporter ATP-binding protein [Rhodopirellula islandica]KLU03085.1 ABC transporter, ATP-binding protein [Rhodopirellula islandica]